MRQPFFLLLLIVAVLVGCEKQEAREERLARTYCGSCHLFPEPHLLDRKTWTDQVMPQMAFRMGLDASPLSSVPEEDQPFVLPMLPVKPMVTEREWQSIINYFERAAPDSLAPIEEKPASAVDQFAAELVSLSQNRFPLLSLLKADTSSNTIFTSSRFNWLHQYDYQFHPKDSVQLTSPASSILILPDRTKLVLQMGIMDPNDQPRGSLVKIAGPLDRTSLLDSLKRPVHVDQVDLNRDNLPDFVIASFGNYTGDLSIYENLGGERYQKRIISALPGTRRTVVKDVNNDGLPDILALITQGDEQITLFMNAGNFQFRINTLLKFPPVYGSSYVDVADFNQDGYFDLLYTNGDNADYSITLKPYHGVHVFLNDGKNQFKENWYYPMHGASQALARDFDKDGDLDIAAISFFPDFLRTPERSFLYFENRQGKFEAFTTPLAVRGRWLLLETTDLDGDSDEDIIVGALDFNNGVPPSIVEGWKSNPASLLVLRNKHF